MTNTFDGNRVLDIDENKDQSGHLIKFKKTGFANNNEYVVMQLIMQWLMWSQVQK